MRPGPKAGKGGCDRTSTEWTKPATSRIPPLVGLPVPAEPPSASQGIGPQVPTFHMSAWTGLAPPLCRAPPGQQAGHPPGSSRRLCSGCGFDASYDVSTRARWFASARLPGPHLTRSSRALSVSAHHPRHDPAQRTEVCSLPLPADCEGPSFIAHAASLQSDHRLHRCPPSRSWHTTGPSYRLPCSRLLHQLFSDTSHCRGAASLSSQHKDRVLPLKFEEPQRAKLHRVELDRVLDQSVGCALGSWQSCSRTGPGSPPSRRTARGARSRAFRYVECGSDFDF